MHIRYLTSCYHKLPPRRFAFSSDVYAGCHPMRLHAHVYAYNTHTRATSTSARVHAHVHAHIPCMPSHMHYRSCIHGNTHTPHTYTSSPPPYLKIRAMRVVLGKIVERRNAPPVLLQLLLAAAAAASATHRVSEGEVRIAANRAALARVEPRLVLRGAVADVGDLHERTVPPGRRALRPLGGKHGDGGLEERRARRALGVDHVL